MDTSQRITELQQQIDALRKENELLRKQASVHTEGEAVKVPADMKPLFDLAQQTVSEYFQDLKMDPAKGTIEINDQRYVLVRASGLSKGFLDTIQSLYADRGEQEAMTIGKNFLFDIAHVIGMNDAKNFHTKMNLTDPIAKLSAGPVHFAYTGWAFVDILPESVPTPDDNFYLIYEHPYSFEADSWLRAGKKASTSVCIMNAGYSSGWCEASFGIQLTAVEVSCIAKGDDCCRFIMSPPNKIQQHLDQFHLHSKNKYRKQEHYEIPTFFERKKVEEEMQRSRLLAEESSRSKSDFVANMSHELRTPLGAILGFTDLLQKTHLNNTQQEYLEAISSSGNNLLAIINDVLDLSKIDAGKFIMEEIPFSVEALLHSIETMFTLKANAKGLKLTCFVDPGIKAVVTGDPMRLTQALVNLVGNAIKFTEKGSIQVLAKLERETEESVTLQFSVSDTGIGIPVDKASMIFERFTQADTDITRKYGGTGLGLAITRQLIELQGGSIASLNKPDGGAEFYFTITYKKPKAEVTLRQTDNSFNINNGGTRKRILLVEDNIMNQKLAGILLENNHFDVMAAGNGQEAVALLREHTFDCILMDLQMPLMDGYQATKIIRSELQVITPIIATTAHALAGEREKCLRAGMSDYLPKPFRETTLLQVLGKWLSQPLDSNIKEVQEIPSKGIIDLSFLLTQTRNNIPFVREMIAMFISENPKNLQALQSAIQSNDFKSIYKSAHVLRNTLGFFGLDTLIGAEMLRIEQLAHQEKELKQIEADFIKTKLCCEQAITELNELQIP